MSWTLAHFKDLTASFQSLITPLGLVIAGAWAYRRYVFEEARYPHIESSAEIKFVSQQGDFWICELKAILENKGRVQHKIESFHFDLNALYEGDAVLKSQKWGGQVHFPHEIAKGSFKPESFSYFVIGPGVTAKYSYVARVPKEATTLLLHCWFSYTDGRGYSHSMETSVATPSLRVPYAGQEKIAEHAT